jgi:large subunit ribosomal protein L22
MIAKASLKYARGSSKKFKLIIDTIRGKRVEDALSILMSINKGPKDKLIKLVKSAVSNAKDKEPDITKLYISRIVANQAPSYKRFRAEAFGRASVIRKRSSHIDLELEKVAPKKVASKTKPAAKAKAKIKAKTAKKAAPVKVKKQKEK